jgi:hypothetical protein
MFMHLGTIAAAAAVGAMVALLCSGRAHGAQASSATRIEVKELVLLNDQNQPAARLESIDGRTVFRFLGTDSAPAMEIGMDSSGGTR